MDQAIRNKLRTVVTQCRRLLEEAVDQLLQGQFGIHASGKRDEVKIEDASRMGHLSDEDRQYREQILVHFEHIQARRYKPADALTQLIREVVFTHLNRLCAYKMMEKRGLIREALSRGMKSQGFLFYLADHPEEERRVSGGEQDLAYKHFLQWLGGTLSEEIGVLFAPTDPANRLFPPQRVLDEVLGLLNGEDLKDIWSEDETIGWVYQYFTPKELREQVRKESQAPRNSYELAFRNQFFTPRYVVEFLTDNTLGRLWYEMRKGDTRLKDECRYLVRRPTEVFLADGEATPDADHEPDQDLSQEEMLKQPVYIPHRPKKDPREIKVLDPACGSGHFLLYCFALLLIIYEEAYNDPELGPDLKRDYPTPEEFKKAVPGLILFRNLHGIDIDPRAVQIAALALWLRAQRSYQDMGLKRGERPRITRTNIVCAEPMPGEEDLLEEFLRTLRDDRLESLMRRVLKVPEGTRVRATQAMMDSLGDLVRSVWRNMKLVGEAGSLLKVEEELQGAIAAAQDEWEEKLPLFRMTQYERDQPVKESYVRLVPGEQDTFWGKAEGLVFSALEDYARYASNGQGLVRRLFADDAIHGFAFIDLCRQRFDVILMNPPFGEEIGSSKQLIRATYPTGKWDLYAAFVEMAAARSKTYGRIGVISSRTGFLLPSLQKWREEYLIGDVSVDVVSDLGIGVLDEALVEAVAYVLSNRRHAPIVFISALDAADKAVRLLRSVTCEEGAIIRRSSDLRCLPLSVISYWVSPAIAKLFNSQQCLEEHWGNVRVGLQTSDDFRFLRLFWEVPPLSIGRNKVWVPMAKGGEYQLFVDDMNLLVKWENNAHEMKQYALEHAERTGWTRGNGPFRQFEFYFKGGLTYPERTTSEFSPRILPDGCITGTKGPGIHITKSDDRYYLLGWLSTRLVRELIEVNIGLGDAVESGSAARDYNVRMIGRLPVPKLCGEGYRSVVSHIRIIAHEEQKCLSLEETSRYFITPFDKISDSINEICSIKLRCRESQILRALQSHHKCEQLFFEHFDKGRILENEVSRTIGEHPWAILARAKVTEDEVMKALQLGLDALVDTVGASVGYTRQTTKKSYFADRRIELLSLLTGWHPEEIVAVRQARNLLDREMQYDCAQDILGWIVGCIYGRWDIRLATEAKEKAVLPELDAEILACPPGMLRGSDDLPAIETPQVYPLRIDWDGILVDDPDHPDDIIRRVRDVLELIWKKRDDTIEREAREILGVSDLRDYFRKLGAGGFWDDHVKRYSKSRRKAPIYWLLQSSKKSYALWIYYHRLDRDLLFKALINYVEPKIRLEEGRLEPLRAQRAQAGTSGKGVKTLDKQIEKQEALLSELRDFEAKLRRAANLHLEPDLDDGVVLNIAPLRELVPWKEAKAYWDELLAGQYEWSSIGKQLRDKGLVK